MDEDKERGERLLQAEIKKCEMSIEIAKKELQEALSGKDRLVLETAISLSNGTEFDFDEVFALLFTWCKETILSI